MRYIKDTIDTLDKLNELVNADIQSIVAKGDIKPEDYKNLESATCIMKNTQKAKQIMYELMDMDENENSFGHSMKRGRSPMTGRYVSMGYPMHMSHTYGDGYSMHSYKDRIIANLENKMQTAPTEADKAFIEGLLGFAEGRV